MALTQPPMLQPFFDSSGIMSEPWYLWFVNLFKQVQNIPAPENTDDLAALQAFEQEVPGLPPQIQQALNLIALSSEVQRPQYIAQLQQSLDWQSAQNYYTAQIKAIQNDIQPPAPDYERKRVAELQALQAFDVVNNLGPVAKRVRDLEVKVAEVPEAFSGYIPRNQRLRSCGFSTQSPTVAQQGSYYVCPFAAKISAWNIVVDAGTATVKVWKIASGTAAPTNANSINTSGVSISTGTAIHSTALTDFTTLNVAANDIFAFEITAVSGVSKIDFQLELTAT